MWQKYFYSNYVPGCIQKLGKEMQNKLIRKVKKIEKDTEKQKNIHRKFLNTNLKVTLGRRNKLLSLQLQK